MLYFLTSLDKCVGKSLPQLWCFVEAQWSVFRKNQAKFENDCISRSWHSFKITQPNSMILVSFSSAEDALCDDVKNDIFILACKVLKIRWSDFWGDTRYKDIYNRIWPSNIPSGPWFIITQQPVGEINVVFLVPCICALFEALNNAFEVPCFRVSVLHPILSQAMQLRFLFLVCGKIVNNAFNFSVKCWEIVTFYYYFIHFSF